MFFIYVSISNIMHPHLNSDDGKGVAIKGSPNGFSSVLGIDNNMTLAPTVEQKIKMWPH